MRRAGMINVEELAEFKRSLKLEKEELIPLIPTLRDPPEHPPEFATRTIFDDTYFDENFQLVHFANFKLIPEGDPLFWSWFHDEWEPHAEEVKETIDEFVTTWTTAPFPHLDGSSARGTFFKQFKRHEGKSGEKFPDRVTWRPGMYDAERRNELAGLLGYFVTFDDLFLLMGMAIDYEGGEADPREPLTQDVNFEGPPQTVWRPTLVAHGINNTAEGVPAKLWWETQVAARMAAMRAVLDSIRITLDPGEETLSQLFDCWKKFRRGSQFSWRGE